MRPVLTSSTSPVPVGLLAVGGLVLWIGVDDASAASMGGAVASVGVVTALALLLLVRGWQSHFGADGLSALAVIIVLGTGAGVLWRTGAGLRAPTRRRTPRRSTAVAAGRPARVSLPAGIDPDTLLDELRRHFFDLQAAWDVDARDAMSRMTTPDMLAELCAASSASVGGRIQRTEFLTLDAELLLFEQRESAQVVCVEYSGMVREAAAGETAPFREFWMLTRPEDASSGWRLVRHQGLL